MNKLHSLLTSKAVPAYMVDDTNSNIIFY